MNRKYNQKNIPKAWKKKKEVQRKQKRHLPWGKEPSKTQVNLSKGKKTHKPKMRKTAPWKLSSFVFITSLAILILIVPTAIVIPFGKSDQTKAVTVEKESSSPVEQQATDSPFSVAVMRAQSDKIEDVPLETYVARVVASEMPAEFEMEALKAQSLAARTYIVNHLMYQDEDADSDVSDTTKHQVYKNDNELREQMKSKFHSQMSKIKEAVDATKGEILTYDDTIITPAYFSTSNGYTENAGDYWENDIPYLRSVKSPWDEGTPKFLDQKVFTVNEVEKALAVKIPDDSSFEISRTESDRVNKIGIADKTFTGRDVREKLELRSSDFAIERKNNHLIFKTKGFGHGIGMSQYGANGMAQEGKTYQEIVKHYYRDVAISQLTETAPTLVAKESESTAQ